YYPQHLWRNTEKVILNGEKYSHDLMADEALQFVRDSAKQPEPFFLYLAFTIPHAKLQVPDVAPYADRDWPDNLKKLAAMVTRMDRDVGRLMALLKEQRIDDKTLVLFASDNGAAYRDEVFAHSGALRGNKRDMYEGGIRTPAIARWPGHVAAGVVNQQVWCFYDVFPTLAELVGAPAPARTDGISILPALLKNTTIEHPPLYWEFHERGFDQAARIGNWKGVKLGKDGPIELYDLTVDPSEKTDVAKSHPDVAAKVAEFLKSARTDTPDWPIKETPKKKRAAE
ncbi:MAG TPA: sulfatase-like hydrolase/transferase, partial [Caulifigura sp.]|nr:sulfatase-like hydrolase/transferase [Caulifigura sp.]